MVRFGLFIIMACFVACQSQTKVESGKLNLISDFMESIRDEKIPNNRIIQKFLPVDTTKKMQELENTLLNEMRRELNKDNIRLKYVSYAKAEDEITKTFEVSDLELSNLFFVQKNDSLFIPILISNGRIISFSSLKKGDRRYLLLLDNDIK